jgi:hypothetical protein
VEVAWVERFARRNLTASQPSRLGRNESACSLRFFPRLGAYTSAARARSGGKERRRELFVEGEEEFDALAVGGERFRAVAAFDGAVELLMGAEKIGGHEERVVELGEGGVGVLRAGGDGRHGSPAGKKGGARTSLKTARTWLTSLKDRKKTYQQADVP